MTQNSPSYLGGGSGVTQADAAKYPNPFCDIASLYIPQNLNDSFAWMEYLMLTMPPFMAVVNRVVSYFLTEINLDGSSDDVLDKYEDMLDNRLHLVSQLQSIGRDYFTYGNSFTTVFFPFNRFFICPECGFNYHSKTIDYTFDTKDASFHGRCKKCGYEGELKVIDRPDAANKDRVKIIRWNPKRMHIKVHPVSGDMDYSYDLEPEFVTRIREGKRFFIESTPLDLLRTCCEPTMRNKTSCRFRFNDGSIHHMKEEALAGLPVRGWGIPPLLPYFKLAYYIQLMRRYDEAIALDFIVPFRVLYPQFNGPQGQDALTTISMNTFIAAMQAMVAKKRKNIATYEVAPFPVGYQMIGGEAKQLTPKDSVNEAMQELLSALGFPQELFSGNLTLQAAPVALRLFERQFNVLVDHFNIIIQWVLDRVQNFYRWDKVTGKLSSITLADDLERKSMQMQAAAGMDVSKSTAWKSFGLDYMEEQKRVVQEQKEVQKIQQEAMEQDQAEQANGEGSAPGGPGGNPAATPGDVHEQARQIAHQLLTQTPPTQVRGQLIQILHSNPTLHALVKQYMQEERQQAASQGKTMILEQQRNQG